MTFGYLDAGSGALLLQLLIGGAAGVAAFFRYRWHRLTAPRALEQTNEDSLEVSESA